MEQGYRSYVDTQFELVVEQMRREQPARCHDRVIASLRQSLRTLLKSERDNFVALANGSSFFPATLDACRAHVTAGAIDRALPAWIRRRAGQWAASMGELLARLASDRAELSSAFDLNPDALLDSISVPLGDLHNHGRSVYRLSFDNGERVIYKPRTIGTEATFALTLNWLRQAGFEPALRACRALPRGAYGWMEYVQHALGESDQHIVDYYRRQGAFLALFWLFGATDAIGDNVVVHRDEPIWIDTECICQPDLLSASDLSARLPGWMRHSVLSTAMIFYGKDVRVSPRASTGMNVCCVADRNRVYVLDGLLKPSGLQAVCAGFSDAYNWFNAHASTRAISSEPIAWWRDVEVRVLLRPTMLYAALVFLLAVTQDSSAASDVAERVEEYLYRVDGLEGQAGVWPADVVRAEMVAMRRGDIPYWTTSTASQDLCEAGGGLARSMSSLTGMECIARRTSQMSQADLDQQLWLIQSYLGAPGSSLN